MGEHSELTKPSYGLAAVQRYIFPSCTEVHNIRSIQVGKTVFPEVRSQV